MNHAWLLGRNMETLVITFPLKDLDNAKYWRTKRKYKLVFDSGVDQGNIMTDEETGEMAIIKNGDKKAEKEWKDKGFSMQAFSDILRNKGDVIKERAIPKPAKPEGELKVLQNQAKEIYKEYANKHPERKVNKNGGVFFPENADPFSFSVDNTIVDLKQLEKEFPEIIQVKKKIEDLGYSIEQDNSYRSSYFAIQKSAKAAIVEAGIEIKNGKIKKSDLNKAIAAIKNL